MLPVNTAATIAYAKEKQLPVPPVLGSMRDGTIYVGYLGVGSLSFFRSEKYLDFANYINEQGGIYYHR